MADEYTPTTGQWETYIRNVYAYFGAGDLDRGHENFDRWLAAHDREVRAAQAEADAQIARSWGDDEREGYYDACFEVANAIENGVE